MYCLKLTKILASQFRKKLLFLVVFFICLTIAFLTPYSAHAAAKTWTGLGTDGTCGGVLNDGNKWSCAANWSASGAPASGDTVTFNGTGTKDATIDASFQGTVSSLTIASGYTGTITVARSFTVGSFSQAAGTFNGAAQTIADTGGFTLTAGTFTSTSGNFSLTGAMSISGSPTFNANGGTITFTGVQNTTNSCNSVTFNLIVINKNNSSTFNTGCNFPLGNNPTITGASSATITMGGTFSGTGTLTDSGASSVLAFTSGSSLSGFSGLNVQALSLNSASIDITSYTAFSEAGNLTVADSTLKLPAVTGTFNVASFSLTGTSTFTASPSTMNVSANFTVTGTTTFNANGGTVTFNGASIATLSCNSITFNLVTINKNNTVNVGSSCSLPLGNNPTITFASAIILTVNGTLSGTGTLTVSGTGSTLALASGSILSGFSGLNAYSLTVSGADVDFSSYNPITLAGTLTLSSGTLTLSPTFSATAVTISGGTFTSSSGTLTDSGALTVTGSPTFNHNSGTINFTGTGKTLSCGNLTFNQVNLNNTGALTINSNCSLPLGANPTVANAVTLSGTLSGSGTATWTTGLLTLSSGSSLSTFSGLSLSSLTIAGATANFSSFSSLSVSGAVIVSSGTVTFPSGTNLASTLTVNGGTVAATSGSYSIGSTFTFSSGSFTAPTSTLTVGGALTFSGSPTFSANGGTFNFTGNGVVLSCNNVTFNAVTLNNAGTLTVNSNCTLPLGANPTILNSITLNGALSGSGTATMVAGTLTQNSGSSVATFNGLNLTNYTVAGATIDLSSFTTFSASGSAAVSSGTLTLPNNSTISGNLTLSSTGVFVAPSGNLYLAGNFIHTSGTYTHSSGTLILNGANQTISGIVTTFNNLTKIIPNAAAQTLTFPAGVTETVVGTLNLQGFDTTARLLLRSSTASQWKIDPQATRNIFYLDVKDGNNINATTMEMGGTGSNDSTNNTNFNFGSLNPNAPSSLGPAGVIGNVYVTTLQPTFSFILSDPNPLDTVKFQIQISTAVDFASTVIDYTSVLAAQASKTFTVGQTAGSGTYTTGSSGQTLSTGSYYWRVKTTDNNGLSSSFTPANGGSVAFLVDADSPATFTPTLNVTSPTTNTQPTVTFSTTDNVAVDHYQVKVDSGSFSTQTSPYQVPVLSNGAHTITVRAYDTTGNTRDGSVNVTVDTIPPDAFTPSLDVTSPTNNTQPTVTFSTTDDVGIDHYQIQIDSGSFSTQTSPYQVPVLSNGAHTITVRAFDGGGNYTDGIVHITVDTTAPATFTPTLNVTSPTTNTQPTVTFSTTDTNGINHYEVKIDAGSFSTQTSPYQVPTLSEAAHTITVRAFDNAGNTRDGSVDVTVSSNIGPNDFTPTLNVTSPSNNTAPILSFITTAGSGIDHYEVKIDAGSFITQTSPYQLPTLSEGSHTFTVRAFDSDAQTNDGSVSLIVDTTAPNNFTPVISGGSPNNDNTPNVIFVTTDSVGIGHYEVKIDNGSFSTQTSPYTLTVQSDGTHTITVRAFDTVGNSTDGTVNVTIDTEAPATFTPTLNVTSPTTNTQPTVTFSTTDSVGIDHYEVKIDSGSFITQTSPYQVPALADGSHTITVRAYDTAGNIRDGAVGITVDVNAPDSFTPTLDVTSPTTNTQPTVTFSTTDDVGVDHYQVKVDNGSFSTQTSPYQVPTLADGAHTIRVRAYDGIGNTTDGYVNVTVDTVGPVIFENAPNKISNADITNTTVDVVDNGGVASSDVQATGGVLHCTQTNSTHVNCTVTISASGDLTTTAFDSLGNSTIATISGYIIETVDPVITITAPTKSSVITISDTTIQVTDNYGIGVNDVSAISGGTISCTQTNATQIDCTATVASSGDLVINATDLAGNAAAKTESSYVVTSSPPLAFTPTLNVTSPSSNSAPILYFSTTDSDGIDHYEVKIDTGSFVAQNSPYQLPHLSNGFHTMLVRAFDTLGNFRDGSVSITIDTSVPADFTPTLDVTSPTTNTQPFVTFFTTDNVAVDHYQVQVDNNSFSTQASPYHLPILSEGTHTITVKAIDTAGNFTSGLVTVVIDLTPPLAFTPTLNVTSPTNNNAPILSFTTTDAVGMDHYEVQIDSGSFNTQISPFQLPTFTGAIHVLTVRAFDNAGNTRDGSVGVTVDLSAPDPTPSSSPSSGSSSNPSASVCYDTTPGLKTPWLYSASAQNSSSILVQFTEGESPIDSYILEFGDSSNNYNYGAVAIGDNSSRSYLIKNLTANKTYYFRVRGGNGCAVGNWSNEISAKTKPLISFNQLNVTSVIEPQTPTKNPQILSAYDIRVKVIDTNNKPISGAKLTIHSQIQTVTTDKDGYAHFSDIEPGEHHIQISYNNFQGEQTVNLVGDSKQINLNVVVQAKNILLSPEVIVIVSIFSLVIVILLVRLIIVSNRR